MNIERRLKPILVTLAAAGSIAALSTPAMAGERESLEQLRTTTLSLIELLVQEGVLSKDKAQAIVQQAESAKVSSQAEEADAAPAGSGDKVVRVQYVPEHVKNEMREEIKKDVMAKLNYKAGERLGLPEWIDRIQWEGDMRLRYEMDSFPTEYTDDSVARSFISNFYGTEIDNVSEERNRFRVRARLGAKIKVSDWVSGGIRITTGKVDDPVSPNQTLETSDSKFSFALDRAYLKAEPVSWLAVSGGRMGNPFFSTDLVWDPDLAFDGVAASFKPEFNDRWSAFGTLGAFPIDEVESSDINKAKDKWLFGAQAGLQWMSANRSSAKIGVALYDFKNIEGKSNTVAEPTSYDGTVLAFRQKGNTVFDINHELGSTDCYNGNDFTTCGLASKFRELNLTAQLDLATFNPVHVILTGDYVKNLGFDQKDISRRADPALGILEKENEGYQVKLSVGMPDVVKRHDWQVFGAYKRLEADAVVDAFTDSDFRLGGTDSKGWIIGASYGLDKNTWLNARWISADEISGPPLGIDVLLLDLNAKF